MIFFVFHKISRYDVKYRLRHLKSYFFYQKYMFAELIQFRVNISTKKIHFVCYQILKIFWFIQNVSKRINLYNKETSRDEDDIFGNFDKIFYVINLI